MNQNNDSDPISDGVSRLLRRGISAHKDGRLSEAERFYSDVLEISPNEFNAMYFSGIVAGLRGDFALAAEFIEKALSINFENAEAHFNLGVARSKLGQHEVAVKCYDQAIRILPLYGDAYVYRAHAFRNLGQLEVAIDGYNMGIQLKSDHFDAYRMRGKTFGDLKQYQAAVESYNAAIALRPHIAGSYFERALALRSMGELIEALKDIESAIALQADYSGVHYYRGLILMELNRESEAIASFTKAIERNPREPHFFNDRGIARYAARDHEGALADYNNAILLKLDFAEAYCNRGVAYSALDNFVEAINDYTVAIRLNSNMSAAYQNRGHAHTELKQHLLAIDDYEEALRLNPGTDFLYGTYIHARMSICDWRDLEYHFARLAIDIECGRKVTPCFPVLAVTESLALQRKAAEIYVTNMSLTTTCPKIPAKGPARKRIRIGYYSADFHDHATMGLIAGMLECHDKSQFEVFAFSFGPERADIMRHRATSAVDHFIDARTRSDGDIALLSRTLGIDIAVDLKGFTQANRLGIFSKRAAPIQVGYLGYPGTIGADFIDYLIADRVLIPEHSRRHYSEKIVYLPDTYQVNSKSLKHPYEVCKREALGLPTRTSHGGFVFCGFNASYKINPQIFGAWMKILKQVNDSVLWLLESNPEMSKILRGEANRRGVNATRLIFAPLVPQDEHLARLAAADLFLDTFPCGGHTTTSDALWARLPVVTRAGESLASRVSASLLTSVGMTELIVANQTEYEDLAIKLATDPVCISRIRSLLDTSRLSATLFNTSRITQHLELAFTQMYSRYLENLPPEHLDVRAL